MIKINGIKVLKKCTICKLHLLHSCFPKNKSRWDGYEAYCRKCNVIRAREWRAKNPGRAYQLVKASIARQRYKHNARIMARNHYPIRQICSRAGCFELGEKHHPDYKKPLEIVWLCKPHHLKAEIMV